MDCLFADDLIRKADVETAAVDIFRGYFGFRFVFCSLCIIHIFMFVFSSSSILLRALLCESDSGQSRFALQDIVSVLSDLNLLLSS